MKHILLVVLIGLLFFSCGADSSTEENGTDSTQVSTPLSVSEVMGIAVVEPANRITELSSRVAGVVEKVYVSIGDSVKKGQLILRLESDIEGVQLDQNRAQINTQQKGVAVAQANLEVTESQLQQAQSELSRAQKLFEGKAITLEALEKIQFQVATLKKQTAAQRVNINQQEATLNEFRTNVKLTQINKSQKEVRAPEDGMILSVDIREGEYLSPGGSVAQFAAAGPVMALTEIDELFAYKIEVGQPATIRQQGSDEVITEGIVMLTSPYLRKKSLFSDNSSNLEDRRVREVRVELKDPSKVLLGARVECWIETK